MSKIGREEFVPAKEFQLRWCQNYLSGFHNVPIQQVKRKLHIPLNFNKSIYIRQRLIFMKYLDKK